MEVLIEYDKNGLMQISSEGESVFFGEIEEFKVSPKALQVFLTSLGARVYVKKREFTSENYESDHYYN